MILPEGYGAWMGGAGACRESQIVRSRRRTQVEGHRGFQRRAGVEDCEGETLRETTAFLVNISCNFAKTQRKN